MTEATVKLSAAEKLIARKDLLTKRIESDTAELATIDTAIATAERLASVAEGTSLKVRVGRAETSREVDAVVKGVGAAEDGSRRLKVEVGSGFDAEILTIQDAQIIEIL